jgi:RecA/RadA recombinase
MLTPFSDCKECPPPPEFVIDYLVPKKGTAILVGTSGIGKSTLALNAVISVAFGGQFLEHSCEQGAAIFVNPELPKDVMMERVWKMHEALGYPTPDKSKSRDDNVYLFNIRGNSSSLAKIADDLIADCEKRNISPKLIVFDSLYMFGKGDENDVRQVTENLNAITRVAEETGAGIIITHHTTKGSQFNKALIDRASGSSAYARYPDVQMFLGRLEPQDDKLGSPWRLEFSKTRLTETPDPINLRLNFPLHIADTSGVLDDVRYSEEKGVRKQAKLDSEKLLFDAHHAHWEEKAQDPTVDELAERIGKPKNTVENWLRASQNFEKYKIDGEKPHRVRLKDSAE